MEYKLIQRLFRRLTYALDSMEIGVNEAMADGWSLAGPLTIVKDDIDFVVSQPMTRTRRTIK